MEIYQNIRIYWLEIKYRRQSGVFQFEEDRPSKKAEKNSRTNHQVLLLLNFLQTKSLERNININ